MLKKKALICGVTGQDGSFLAKFLLGKNYDIWGTSRDAQGSSLKNLRKLKIENKIVTMSMLPEDFRSVLVAFGAEEFDEIYFLTGQSSVSLSFEQPVETMQSILVGTLNALEAIRMLNYNNVKIYFAGSSEVFGDTGGTPASEKTPFNPLSPYAVAKASTFWLVDNYRSAYSLFSCTGILFNHESYLRPERFVTKKIVEAARRISAGSKETLELGRLDISRDWGWAPEYVEAMWLMLQQESADDYVISTNQAHTLEYFVDRAFSCFNLDWRDHVLQSQKHMRPTDVLFSQGDSSKAKRLLGWSSNSDLDDVIQKMIQMSD